MNMFSSRLRSSTWYYMCNCLSKSFEIVAFCIFKLSQSPDVQIHFGQNQIIPRSYVFSLQIPQSFGETQCTSRSRKPEILLSSFVHNLIFLKSKSLILLACDIHLPIHRRSTRSDWTTLRPGRLFISRPIFPKIFCQFLRKYILRRI